MAKVVSSRERKGSAKATKPARAYGEEHVSGLLQQINSLRDRVGLLELQLQSAGAQAAQKEAALRESLVAAKEAARNAEAESARRLKLLNAAQRQIEEGWLAYFDTTPLGMCVAASKQIIDGVLPDEER